MVQIYNGHLAPHMSLMKQLSSEGYTPIQIARQLITIGVKHQCWSDDPEIRARSLSALVYYALGKQRYRRTKRREWRWNGWQVWTPQMQEAEFEREYSKLVNLTDQNLVLYLPNSRGSRGL